MSQIQSFFIFCSGANSSLLKRTPVEKNKYASIGATIFFTGLFAAIAAGYACYTIFDNVYASVIMGLFWGLLIFNLDRYIVSTMERKDTLLKNLWSASPRILLALLIAIVIAKPLELKIFESEIESELVLMEQEKYKTQDELTQSRYIGRMDSLKSDIELWKNEIAAKTAKRDELIAIANAEADGTGGSMNKNIGPIYKVKKAAADQAQNELNVVESENLGLIAANQRNLDLLQTEMETNLADLKRVQLSGFAARLEGLERAEQRSNAISVAVLFITLLFIAIELAPILTKLMMPKGPYDHALAHHKGLYTTKYEAPYVKAQMHNKSQKEFYEKVYDHRLKEAIKAEKELSDFALKNRIEEIKKRADLWDEYLKDGQVLKV